MPLWSCESVPWLSNLGVNTEVNENLSWSPMKWPSVLSNYNLFFVWPKAVIGKCNWAWGVWCGQPLWLVYSGCDSSALIQTELVHICSVSLLQNPQTSRTSGTYLLPSHHQSPAAIRTCRPPNVWQPCPDLPPSSATYVDGSLEQSPSLFMSHSAWRNGTFRMTSCRKTCAARNQ